MRWLIGLVVIVVTAVAGDAALRSYVEGRIESQLVSDLGSRSEPDVSLGGFPFAFRLLSGRVPTVTMEARDVRREGLEIERLILDLEGVHISLGTASARVERGEGVAEVDHRVLADYIERRTPLRVIAFDNRRVTVALGGRRATVPLRLEGGAVVLRIPSRDDIGVSLPLVLEGIEYRIIEVGAASVTLTFDLRNATLRSI